MKCVHCGLELSDKVCRIHQSNCRVEDAKENDEETVRLKAKELGIRYWHNMKIGNLLAEIAEKEGE